VPSLLVKVEYLGYIKEFTGNQIEKVEIEEGGSLKELLIVLAEKYRKPFKESVYEKGDDDIKPNFTVTINGHSLNKMNGIKTKLEQGDHIILLPVLVGG
jgi:MoaD family protein